MNNQVAPFKAFPGPYGRTLPHITTDGFCKIVTRLENDQSQFLRELKALQEQHSVVTASLNELGRSCCARILSQNDPNHVSESSAFRYLTREVDLMRSSLDDAANKLRRNNPVLFGLPDSLDESWVESKEKARSFFESSLGEPVCSNSIEYARRLGLYKSDRNRPILDKVSICKDRKRALSYAPRLKGNPFRYSRGLHFYSEKCALKALAICPCLGKAV